MIRLLWSVTVVLVLALSPIWSAAKEDDDEDIRDNLSIVGIYLDILAEAADHSAAGSDGTTSLENLAQIASFFSVMEILETGLKEIDPPTTYASAHGILVQAVAIPASSAELCREAIMHSNSSIIAICTDLVTTSTALLEQFSSETLDVVIADLSDTTDSAVSEEESSPTVVSDEAHIELKDIFFNPDEVTIPAQTDVTVHLENTGAADHSFVNEELGIDEFLPSGTSRLLTLNLPPGEYEIVCDIPGHLEAGMVMTLTVE